MTTQVAGKQAAVLVKFPDGELLDAIVEGARTHERTLQGQIRYLLKKALGRVGADE